MAATVRRDRSREHCRVIAHEPADLQPPADEGGLLDTHAQESHVRDWCLHPLCFSKPVVHIDAAQGRPTRAFTAAHCGASRTGPVALAEHAPARSAGTCERFPKPRRAVPAALAAQSTGAALEGSQPDRFERGAGVSVGAEPSPRRWALASTST